jgi:cytochrome b6-f complex iron-sulfur subunit
MNEPNRRDFLKRAFALWGLISAVPVVGMLAQYLTPGKAATTRETVMVGKTDDIPADTPKIFRFNKEPVVVLLNPAGQYKAFSARCTHLGCVVQFQTEGGPHFGCNCHGSQFDMSGKNVAGPAPRPLAPFRVNLDGKSIYLTKV